MPLGYIFSFSLGLGLNGLWLGMYSGQFVLCSLYQFWFTIRVDWDAKAREAQERTARDENLLSKEEAPS
jgi:Na+-driven multidrug efflux pump